ncbi:hypothetical protein [Cupriavidus sp. TMH.W2]|uniref:hypothetical protein n=1 Tax=Cupriavidus sp. TMH.W2 TaxID=3434465 RepID=UPI003D7775EF
MTRLYLSVGSHDEWTETPAFAVVDCNLWDLRREVGRLRTACLNHGLASAASQCHVAYPDWHDPDDQHCVEGNEMVVGAYGDVRFEGALRYSGDLVGTRALAFSTLTAIAESGVEEWFETSSVEAGVRLAVA